MKAKKRYVLLAEYPERLPEGAKFLFQNERGFIVKADLRATETLRKDAKLISGSIKNLKQPKLLNHRKKNSKIGMK
ncbi:MAG: hypothetical protein JRN20_17640 [Nitrososphaerota archaeon]|nr:hypothetical protein [Nitrososphaerota archaeon]MDG6923579.1 hypothetical protein [Nitrososphaerota archaeon]